MNINIDKQKLKEDYDKCKSIAKDFIKDEEKMEKLLQRAENAIKDFPIAGKDLSYIPVMISLVRRFMLGEYTEIPIGTVIGIVGAIIYHVNPIDLIPDMIPVAGKLDDISVYGFCYKKIEKDLEEYKRWREENGKVL